jgi:hypothetical protein
VELGSHQYNLELVLDAPAGKLQAYILDAHMENFVRVSAASFEVGAQLVSGQGQTLTFKPVANSATGETVGDTSLFEAQADWLKAETAFDGVLKELAVRDSKFTNIAFQFKAARPAQTAK